MFSKLQTCHDFSSTRSITLTVSVGLECCFEEAIVKVPTALITSISDARFILTFSDCVCDSGALLTCDAQLSVTETVSETEVSGILNELRNVTSFDLECSSESTVQISVLGGSSESLASESERLSSCLDWVRPADWTPRNDPNWIPMNACCGPKKYNNNMNKCCSGSNVHTIYDDATHVCCNGMVYGGSACHI